MPSRPSHSLTDIVLALADGGVELILVGGLAVHSRSEAALARAKR